MKLLSSMLGFSRAIAHIREKRRAQNHTLVDLNQGVLSAGAAKLRLDQADGPEGPQRTDCNVR